MLIRPFHRWFILFACALIFALPPARAQQVNPGTESGVPAYGSFHGSDFDKINLMNSNLHIDIPLLTIKERGRTFTWRFYIEPTTWSKQWIVVPKVNPTSPDLSHYAVSLANEGGLTFSTPYSWSIGSGPVSKTLTCASTGQPYEVTTNFSVVDPEGTIHPLPLVQETGSACNGSILVGPTMDGSGYSYNLNTNTIVGPDGTQIVVGGGSFQMEDANGNLASFNSSSNAVLDTLGRNPVTITQGPNSTFTSPLGQTRTAPQYTLYTVTDSNGQQQTYRLDYQLIDLKSNMCTQFDKNCQEAGGATIYPKQITLPTGKAYVFTYNNDTPGELAQVNLPTGGSISYTYANSYFPQNNPQQGSNPPNYAGRRGVASRTVTLGSVNHTWTYASQGTVTDPLGNVEVHSFGYLSDGTHSSTTQYEQSVTYKDPSGNVLRTVTKDYAFELNPQDLTLIDGRVIRETTTLDNSQVRKTETDYETFQYACTAQVYCGAATRMNPTEVREFDYGSGSPGPLLRRTDYTYLHQGNTAYGAANVNIVHRVASVTVYDSTSNTCAGKSQPCAQTTKEYDNYTTDAHHQNIQASGAVQHDSARGTSYTLRGNLTASSSWRNTDGALLTTYHQFDDAGNILATIDPNGNKTTYDYTDSWTSAAGGSTCAPPNSGQGKAYLTKLTNALGQVTKHSYFSCSGLTASTTDANSLTTATTYDLLGRVVQLNSPDGGQTSHCYTDVGGVTCSQSGPPYQTVTKSTINTSLNKTTTMVFDGLGRTVQPQINSDPQGTVFADTTYDVVDRVSTVSNPYRQGTDITTTTGTTTYAYDALSRKTSETYPDNSVLTTAYCGSSTLVTDPAVRWRRSRVDGLGWLAEVDEPNAVGATVASTGCPASGGGEPIFVTAYSYDILGNLLGAVQNGSRQRTFTYDSLSHLLTSTNPESGTITYTYDANGNMLTKKDARGITTTYTYDALNREKTVSYSNGDPGISINYDEANCLGLSTCQNIGQRTSMTDAAGSEAWSFQIDATNHRSVHVNQRTIISSPSNIAKTTTYFLDLAGNVTQVIYPTGRTVNYTYDAANRPSSAADGSNGITYAAGFDVSPGGTCSADATCYTPQGTFYALSIGETASFTGLNISHSYNSRLQPLEFKASSTGGNAIDITYNFVDPVSTHNAGHVYGITNNLNSARSQSFTYDQLNRIASAGTSATSGATCWGYQYSYDAWGNLLSQAAWTPTYNGCTETTMAPVTADANNHISGLTYDPAGNTLTDGQNIYTWDAESQLKTAAGVSYNYDGDGRRVSKSNGKLYWYGSGGEILAETDATGKTLNEYIFFGGKRIAILPASSSPLYYAEDFLGSSRVMVTSTGAVCYDADFTPFGAERTITNTCPQNNYKFEGKERDAETGNDDFGARYYSNRLGRWLSSDWSAVPVAVPYANLTNPQTLNLYSMVADDPESFADLDGHTLTSSATPYLPNPFAVSADSNIGSAEEETEHFCAAHPQYCDDSTAAEQQDKATNTNVTYVPYDVNGATAADALGNASTSCSGGTSAGCTSWSYKYTDSPSGSVSGGDPPYTATLTADVTVNVSVTVKLPNWVGYKDASPEQQKVWDAALAKLKDHEEGHVAIDKTLAGDLRAALQGTKATGSGKSQEAATRAAEANLKAKLTKRAEAVVAKLRERNTAYDEATHHGVD